VRNRHEAEPIPPEVAAMVALPMRAPADPEFGTGSTEPIPAMLYQGRVWVALDAVQAWVEGEERAGAEAAWLASDQQIGAGSFSTVTSFRERFAALAEHLRREITR
jgi:hypothetical protein